MMMMLLRVLVIYSVCMSYQTQPTGSLDNTTRFFWRCISRSFSFFSANKSQAIGTHGAVPVESLEPIINVHK